MTAASRRIGLWALSRLPVRGPAPLRDLVVRARTYVARDRLSTRGLVEAQGLDQLIPLARALRQARRSVDHRSVVARMVQLPPKRSHQLDLVMAELLAAGAPELFVQWRENLALRRATARWSADAVAELDVVAAHAQGRQPYQAAVARARSQPRGAVVLMRALAAIGDWELLEQVLHESRTTSLPKAELAERSAAALRAGRLSVAVLLASHAPRSRAARRVRREAAERLQLAESGWRFDPVQPRSYQPSPGVVLSVLSQSLPHRSGGYATRSHGILTGLLARGWRVGAITRLGFPGKRGVRRVDTVDGVSYHRALGRHGRGLQEYVARFADHVIAQARSQRAALIHASSFYATGLAGAVAARRLGIPFVYEMRGLEELMQVSRDPAYADSEGLRFLSRMETDVCLAADAVLAITEALRSEMISRGVPAERVTVVPNGVHPQAFADRPRDAELERDLGAVGKQVIGYAGGLVDYEGLELLIAATAQLVRRRSDFVVVVVGDGPHQGMLRGMVTGLGLESTIRFTGRVPHSQVPRYLSLFDITPFPRRSLPVCELISPMKPYEAMAMGKAVVVSSVAALTEIVQHEQTGLVFAKDDEAALATSLERLLVDPELRARLGEAAREWIDRAGSWDAAVDRVESVYRRLLGRDLAAVTPSRERA